MNWNWPSTKTNDMLPWYRILLNLLVAPLYFTGVFLCCFAVAVSNLSISRGLMLFDELK